MVSFRPLPSRGRGQMSLSSQLVTPARFERATYALGGRRSIQLSYGAVSAVKDSKSPQRPTAFDSVGRTGVGTKKC